MLGRQQSVFYVSHLDSSLCVPWGLNISIHILFAKQLYWKWWSLLGRLAQCVILSRRAEIHGKQPGFYKFCFCRSRRATTRTMRCRRTRSTGQFRRRQPLDTRAHSSRPRRSQGDRPKPFGFIVAALACAQYEAESWICYGVDKFDFIWPFKP